MPSLKEQMRELRLSNQNVLKQNIVQNDLDYAVNHPLTMIATDSIIENGKGHPRTAGTFSKVLGEYVREKKQITLIDALKKMTIIPAQRLEKRAPIFKKKGRLQVGTHADIVTFNPNTIIDTSSYTNPTSPPNGISNVIVGGNHLIHNKTMITNKFNRITILLNSMDLMLLQLCPLKKQE